MDRQGIQLNGEDDDVAFVIRGGNDDEERSDPGNDATARNGDMGTDNGNADGELNSIGSDEESVTGPFNGGEGEGLLAFTRVWYDEHEDGFSSEDSLDDLQGSILVRSFREAAEVLEANAMGAIHFLAVTPQADEEGEDEVQNINGSGNDARSVRQFVSSLGQWRRGVGCSIRNIYIGDMDWESHPQEDSERLCRDVLPTHPTLEGVVLAMKPPYGAILASSIRVGCRTRVLELCGAIDRETVQSVADMIRRDTPLTRLHVFPCEGPKLNAGNCQLLCQSVSRNTNLRKLILNVGMATGGALDGAVASSSPLWTLKVYVDEVSHDCAFSFARELRTNTTLEHLRLVLRSNEGTGRPSPFLGPIAEALEKFNVTLRKVVFTVGRPAFPSPGLLEEVRVVNSYMRRNRRIRRALEQLEPQNYRVSPTSLWPGAFEMVTTLPTLLYRFLRRGNLEEFCDKVLKSEGTTKGKKRARAIDVGSMGGQDGGE